MAALRSFEHFIQGLIEGSALRLMRSQIEPVEIAKRLEAEAERHRKVGVRGIMVPSHYSVGLHPNDYDALTPIVDDIQTELAIFLAKRIKEQGWTMTQTPSVSISPDPSVRLKMMHVTPVAAEAPSAARPVLIEPPPLARTVADTEAIEATRAFAPAVTGSTAAVAKGPALVRIDPAGAGWRHRLGAMTRIGRGLDNDMVLEERTVSRYHCEIHQQGDEFFVVDLESTNGVQVNGRRVRRQKLYPGDRVRVGSVEFAFDLQPDA